MKAVESEIKIKEFREILPIVQQANLPNLDVLDKLMRYQTSLNNQLSKQMDELIELENVTAIKTNDLHLLRLIRYRAK